MYHKRSLNMAQRIKYHKRISFIGVAVDSLNDEMKQILIFLNLNRKTGIMASPISEIIRVAKGRSALYRRGGKIKQVVLEQMQITLQTLESMKLIEQVLDGEYQITKDGIAVAAEILKQIVGTQQPLTVEDNPFARHFWQLLGF